MGNLNGREAEFIAWLALTDVRSRRLSTERGAPGKGAVYVRNILLTRPA